MTDPTEKTEWSLVLAGDPKDLGSLTQRKDPDGRGVHEMNELTEREAWRRLERWNALHPKVQTTLRRRVLVTHYGEWEEVR